MPNLYEARATALGQPRQCAGHLRVRWLVLSVGLALIVSWALLAGSRLGRDASLVRSPLLGRPAPDFVLETLEGGPVSASDFAGRVYVVDFWASWCVPCRAEAPQLESFFRRWSPRRVGMVDIVHNDSAAAAKAFRQEFGLTFPQAMDPDGRAAIDFGVFGVPETYVIDQRGVVMPSSSAPSVRRPSTKCSVRC